MVNLIFQIIGGIISFWLAIKLVPGVEFIGKTQYLIIAGAFLGLVNFFIKPIINLLTLPLRILTLGLFGLIVDMTIIWLVSIFFPELIIKGLMPLFWTTLIVWLVAYFLGFYSSRKKII